MLLRFNEAGNHVSPNQYRGTVVSPVLQSLEYRKAWEKIADENNNRSKFMSNNTHNSNSNSNSNWYITLAVEDKDKEEVGSLHTISDHSITTIQAITKEGEEQQLELEL